MTKINGQAVVEMDNAPGFRRPDKALINAACDAALIRRGEDPLSGAWSSKRFYKQSVTARKRKLSRVKLRHAMEALS
jgi:hypothetical protein